MEKKEESKTQSEGNAPKKSTWASILVWYKFFPWTSIMNTTHRALLQLHFWKVTILVKECKKCFEHVLSIVQ
jgi:hypothetical protein